MLLTLWASSHSRGRSPLDVMAGLTPFFLILVFMKAMPSDPSIRLGSGAGVTPTSLPSLHNFSHSQKTELHSPWNYSQWGDVIFSLASHLVSRFGIDAMAEFPFEARCCPQHAHAHAHAHAPMQAIGLHALARAHAHAHV